jgi:hypothetical protein
MSIVDELHATHPSEVVGVVTRALIEYLDEVSELAVADLDVAGMAAQIASRIRFGFHADDTDPTPPHGIERPRWSCTASIPNRTRPRTSES